MANEKRLIDAKCGDCLYFPMCSHYVDAEETFPEVGGCRVFKRKDAFVEVVRCKDCKHWTMGYCNHFAYYDYEPTTNEDDFCSYGERREGE